MKVLFSASRTRNFRGAGLGNELFPIAKAFLASRALGIAQLSHPWFFNERGYARELGMRPWDWIPTRVLSRVIPSKTLTVEDYVRLGQFDYGDFVVALQREGSLPDWGLIISDGMWGGYRAIKSAREFLKAYIQSSTIASRKLSEWVKDDVAIRVGIHIRLGDFNAKMPPGGSYRGVFNYRLPLTWYASAIKSIRDQASGLPLQFRIFSDETPSASTLETLGLSIEDVVIASTGAADILRLAYSDLIVCSVSSFSLMAAFIGNVPYVWPFEQLSPNGSGYAIWPNDSILFGLEREIILEDMPTNGMPFGDGAVLNGNLGRILKERLDAKNRSQKDLLYYSTVEVAG